VIVIAAFGVDHIGAPQPFEDHLPGQAVQLENVEFPPAEAVQPDQVLNEPAVIACRRDRGRGDEHRPRGRESLAN
jgi:hypothetical protein